MWADLRCNAEALALIHDLDLSKSIDRQQIARYLGYEVSICGGRVVYNLEELLEFWCLLPNTQSLTVQEINLALGNLSAVSTSGTLVHTGLDLFFYWGNGKQATVSFPLTLDEFEVLLKSAEDWQTANQWVEP